MHYTIIVVSGIPSDDLSSCHDKSHYSHVKCPNCLDDMYVTTSQLVAIFTHIYVEDNGEEMDVMCADCVKENLDDYYDFRYKKKVKIIPPE